MHERLAALLATLDLDTHVLYVDDGSRDQTWAVLESLAAHDPRVGLLRLSRNFGKELAPTAGLDHAGDCDAVIVMDADGQDPTELIPQFCAQWREGFDTLGRASCGERGGPYVWITGGGGT